jgi:predicted metal-dependent hydrolase
MRRIVRPWLAYFRPDFHPWQQDNLDHVERWKAAYAATGAAPA